MNKKVRDKEKEARSQKSEEELRGPNLSPLTSVS